MATPEVILQHRDSLSYIIRSWVPQEPAWKLLHGLRQHVPWQRYEFDNPYRVGTTYLTPREMFFLGTEEVAISRPNFLSWTRSVTEGGAADLPGVEFLRYLVEPISQLIGQPVNTCILNHYRDGNDFIAPHADREVPLDFPTIAGLSLGENRTFVFSNKNQPNWKVRTLIQNGDLLVMTGSTQLFWRHGVPKQPGATPRISATYRYFDPRIPVRRD